MVVHPGTCSLKDPGAGPCSPLTGVTLSRCADISLYPCLSPPVSISLSYPTGEKEIDSNGGDCKSGGFEVPRQPQQSPWWQGRKQPVTHPVALFAFPVGIMFFKGKDSCILYYAAVLFL